MSRGSSGSPWERFTGSRDRRLAWATGVAAVLWIACVGPVRTWALDMGIRSHWFFGIAPSLFAGTTFAMWQMLVSRTSPLPSVMYGVVLCALAEAVQLAMPRATADPLDALAGAIGAVLALPILLWRWPAVRST
ncbi:MAG: hypothetical protein AAGI52_02240 [Bacteroidota bacterium]